MIRNKARGRERIMKESRKITWNLTWLTLFWVVLPVYAQETKAVKPLVLRIAEMSPATGTRPAFLQKACKEVERLTEGRIKTEIYWSESMVKVKEIPKAIQRGVCDLGWIAASYHPAEFPLWTHYMMVLYHPQGDDAAYLARKAWELFDRSKALRDDMEKIGQTAWFCCPYDSYPMYSKKAVKNLDDIKGMRVRVSGEGFSKMVRAIGGHPTFIPASDTYTGLERGTVDGAIAGWEWGKRYAFYEVVPYVVETDVFMQYGFNNVSLAALRKMSEADRKIFLEVGRRVSIEFGEAMKKERDDYKNFMQGKGAKILPFPAEEKAKWADFPEVKALIKGWIDQQNAAGRPGTEVMRTFLDNFGITQWMPPGY
jgi:TRAP-type C4-dicarboxylate transport system substrate-binding protein